MSSFEDQIQDDYTAELPSTCAVKANMFITSIGLILFFSSVYWILHEVNQKMIFSELYF